MDARNGVVSVAANDYSNRPIAHTGATAEVDATGSERDADRTRVPRRTDDRTALAWTTFDDPVGHRRHIAFHVAGSHPHLTNVSAQPQKQRPARARHDGTMTISLRPWQADDATALVKAAHESPDLSTQFGGASVSTVDDAAAFIAHSLRFDDRTKHWAVLDGGDVIGNVGVSAIEYRHETAWISYWLAADARGRRIAADALIAVCDWAFANGLHRLELGHRVNNPASCRVATAAGFVREGVEREKLLYGSERFDVETHARLRSDPAPTATRAMELLVD